MFFPDSWFSEFILTETNESEPKTPTAVLPPKETLPLSDPHPAPESAEPDDTAEEPLIAEAETEAAEEHSSSDEQNEKEIAAARIAAEKQAALDAFMKIPPLYDDWKTDSVPAQAVPEAETAPTPQPAEPESVPAEEAEHTTKTASSAEPEISADDESAVPSPVSAPAASKHPDLYGDDFDYIDINTDDIIQWKGSTYEIVSKIAYLIGVPQKYFNEAGGETIDISVYKKLDLDKNARIIRNLCLVRTAIERNFKAINEKMKYEFRSVSSVPEYIPSAVLMQLSEDGASFIKKSSTQLCHHIIEINRLISDRINNCRELFPLWLDWNYIHELFIMPNGLTENGTKAAADLYYANKFRYPYQMYINWMPREAGNILYNDKKFVTLLYSWHHDRFTDMAKVSDAGSYIKNTIYEFIDAREKVVVMVDCENSDPYKVCATFRGLSFEYTQKISRIILFDDVNTVDTWKVLEQFTSIPIEYLLIERVKSDKSLVDLRLTTRTCEEHYRNNVDGFILVSSDSDYWGLISSLPDAHFLVMLERDACGADLKRALESADIFYCYIDDFYTGSIEELRRGSLQREIRRYIDNNLNLNLMDVLNSALYAARIHMSDSEKQQFFTKYLKTMQLTIADNGDVTLAFKR